MKNKEQQQLDDFFKNRLEENSIPPSFDNWEKIVSHLEGEQFDHFVKNELQDIAPTPPPRVWNNIKSQIPLSLWLRNHLNWMSKIAAALIVFMVVVLVFDKKENKNINEEASSIVKQEIDKPLIEKDLFEDFTLAIENEIVENKTTPEEEFILDIEISDEDIFSLLEDEEDFEIDEEVVENSLEPYTELPSETAEASIQKMETQPPLNFPQVETYSNDK